MTTIERENLIVRYLSLAEALAKKSFRSAPRGILLADLISVAYVGLVDAANKYQPGFSFVTYAFYRINGEISSFIRSEVRFRRKNVSIDAENAQGGCLRDGLEDHRAKNTFDVLIERLNPIGKQLLVWYYIDRMTMTEIGEKLGVKQPRVSKLLRYYTMKLAA